MEYTAGTVVRFRDREWLVVHSDKQQQLLTLRPLTGGNTTTIFLPLSHSINLSTERIEPATFPQPTAEHSKNFSSFRLFWQAAKFSMQNSVAPIRSLHHIAVRPRIYQFVPLLAALRLQPIRLLIADDVGVGKTIEALLIARELWDRGEIRRIAVLCPPHLCTQWKQEMEEKFGFQPVIFNSRTILRLERQLQPGETVFQAYPVHIISVDWIKQRAIQEKFQEHCPEFVIIDEAHTVVPANVFLEQRRYEVVRHIAQDAHRHLVLLTATPHNGFANSFAQLLGLLREEFATWDPSLLSKPQQQQLAHYVIRRTRYDIQQQWKNEHFPKRQVDDNLYSLSPALRRVLELTEQFCREVIVQAQHWSERARRYTHWSALTLLRCVTSSPAAAIATLQRRQLTNTPKPDMLQDNETSDDSYYDDQLADLDTDVIDDESPTTFDTLKIQKEQEYQQFLQRKAQLLSELMNAAQWLYQHPGEDSKLQTAIKQIETLLRQGFAPIVWCQFVDTAEYVADNLRTHLAPLFPSVQICCVTGRIPDRERQEQIAALDIHHPRVLVATDCLSEGINLQDKFTAALHYDLPWNPNRLEQREGRIDRYGQRSNEVKIAYLYSAEDTIDQRIIRVLVNKAHEIRRSVGIYVPIPAAYQNTLPTMIIEEFLSSTSHNPEGTSVTKHQISDLWEEEAAKVEEIRRLLAHKVLDPSIVQAEYDRTDFFLGSPEEVEQFLIEVLNQWQIPFTQDQHTYIVHTRETDVLNAPPPIRTLITTMGQPSLRCGFDAPGTSDAILLNRNHPLIQQIARYLFESTIEYPEKSIAARCAALITSAVSSFTYLFLLRIRYKLQLHIPSFSIVEEIYPLGFHRIDGLWHPLSPDRTFHLLNTAQPTVSLDLESRQRLISTALTKWKEQFAEEALAWIQSRRVQDLRQQHAAIRATQTLLKPSIECLPPIDLLGVVVLLPESIYR